MLERLQKLLAQAGISSRREAETLITGGRVSVNGAVVTELGSKADPDQDTITVDGKPVRPVTDKVYILLHKPAGYVTTLKDPQGRPLVTDLLKEITTRVFPVGRLDYNTEGLLLLTNDGEWSNRLAHPRHEVDKEYHVRVRWMVEEAQLEQLRGGVVLDDGPTAPARVRLIKASDNNTWLSIVIHEGRYRQVRRMCEKVGLSVVRLRRAGYGPLELGSLKPGEFRLLTAAEVQALTDSKPVVVSVPKPKQPARKPARQAGPRGPRSSNRESSSRPAESDTAVQTLVWRKPGTEPADSKRRIGAKTGGRAADGSAPAARTRLNKGTASRAAGQDAAGAGGKAPRDKTISRKAGVTAPRTSPKPRSGNAADGSKPAAKAVPGKKSPAGPQRENAKFVGNKQRRAGEVARPAADGGAGRSRQDKATSTGKRPAGQQPGRPPTGRKGPKGRGPGRG
ncbi:MAG TPA: pseudouridine synthase [Geobacteraceae bacterium]